MGTCVTFSQLIKNNRPQSWLHTLRVMRVETSDAQTRRLHEVVFRMMHVIYFILHTVWIPNYNFY